MCEALQLDLPATELKIKIVLAVMIVGVGRDIRTPSGLALHRRDPVRLPAPATVFRERLLEVAGRSAYVGPEEAHENAPAIKHLSVIELTSAVLEFTDQGIFGRRVRAIRPVDAPLATMGIVEPQRQPFDVTV